MLLCLFLFLPCLASAQNCPLWLGTWEVKNADNSTRIWKIYESTNDTGSSVVLCKAFGISETKAGTDQVLFMVLFISFTNTYSYTEEAALTSSMKSTEMDVTSTSDAFISRPDGAYPVMSGKKISSEVPPKPTITTTTTSLATTTTTTAEPASPCPLAASLENKAHLTTLRALRNTMRASTYGMLLTAMYYQHAAELTMMLEDQPELKKQLQALIQENMPIADALIAGEQAFISRSSLQNMLAFLSTLRGQASPLLLGSIDFIIKGVKQGYLLNGLGVWIKE